MDHVKTPMEINGTSGVQPDDVRLLAAKDICKLNIETCLRQQFGQALKHALQ